MIKKATWMTKKRILIESNVTKDMMVIQDNRKMTSESFYSIGNE